MADIQRTAFEALDAPPQASDAEADDERPCEDCDLRPARPGRRLCQPCFGKRTAKVNKSRGRQAVGGAR